MELIDKILREWAYRVHDGMPNLKNPLHIVQLKETLNELNLPKQVTEKLLNNLRAVEEEYNAIKKDTGNTSTFDSEEARDAAIRKGTHSKVDSKKDPSTKTKTTSAEEEPFTPEQEEQRTHLRNTDRETVKNELELTKDEAKARAKQKGEKGVGAGTAESRAGECATVTALKMRQEGKSYKVIEEYLLGIADDKNTFLKRDWVKGALECTRYIEEKYGLDNIDEIVWDTPSGRELINVRKHGTSADMFITLKNGKRIGISLKKDGNVFILNGGYDKNIQIMAEELEKYGVDSDKFLNGDPDDPDDKGVGIEGYKEDRAIAFQEGTDELIRAFPLLNAALNDYMDEDGNITNHEKAKKDFGDGYAKYLDILNKDEEGWRQFVTDAKNGKLSGDEMKSISKLAKANPHIRQQMPKIYNAMRQAEINLTSRILKKAQEDPKTREALKEIALKGIHVESILGIDDNDQLDEFITVYGEPGGAELNPETLVSIFGLEELYEDYKNSEGEEREKIRKQMKSKMRGMIRFDFKDGARNGIVKIKHEGPPVQEFPLFTILARTKPIGSSPALEMGQTTYMVNAIKYGFDTDNWPDKQYNNMIKKQIDELAEILEDTGGVGDGKDLQKQIKELQKKLR